MNRLKIYNIEDLFRYYPKEYEDRSKFSLLSDSILEENTSLEVEITGIGQVLRPRRNMSITKVPFKDRSGNGYLTFFNQEYLKNQFMPGEIFKVHGKLKKIGKEYQLSNPIFEKKDEKNKIGSIVPVYSLTKGLSNNDIIKIMKIVIKENMNLLQENLPSYLLDKYNLMPIGQAIKQIHFPEDMNLLKRAQDRLKFEELFILQLGLFMIKNGSNDKEKGISFLHYGEIDEIIEALPFELTSGQKRVIDDIEKDMNSDLQMNRLIQGDVGSGKTIVAAVAMFKAVKCGYQSAMLAPTEILASQHFESLHPLFNKWNIKCELLIGSLSAKKKEDIVSRLKEGQIDILIGTHAIIQEGIVFNKLGLAITDEQHRFGVRQRAVLNQKGSNPDIIVMTATPIPRTLALILYGDLDISIIDELPPGRKEIETFAVGANMIDRMNGFIRKQIENGRQAYIVCPLIEESESLELNSAEEIYIDLKENIFKEYNVGLLHGKMKSSDKDEVMINFKNGKIDILVATTVIEVGVNVTNANIMTIYNSERFGLAQLHQLRGRVGRGQYQSYCILVNYSHSKIARERMRILQQSTDGFIISEKDLELRGPGEFFGTRQHGLPELKIANLFTDIKILQVVQKEALEIMKIDKNLEGKEYSKVKKEIRLIFSNLENDLILN